MDNGPMTVTTEEEMKRFYQDLSQAVKQVPNGNMLLDRKCATSIAKVGIKQTWVNYIFVNYN